MLVYIGQLEPNTKMITKQQLKNSLPFLISLPVRAIVWILAITAVLTLTTAFLFQSFYLIALSKKGMLRMTLQRTLNRLKYNSKEVFQKILTSLESN